MIGSYLIADPDSGEEVRVDVLIERLRAERDDAREKLRMSNHLLAVKAEERNHFLGRLQRVCRVSDRLLDCLNEFAPDYPQACSDWARELDTELDATAYAGHYERSAVP